MTPKIGLALGSGALRGLAHIGVLQVFQEEEIPIYCIAGSSVGAVIGGAYCAGQSPYVLADIARGAVDREYYDLIPPRMALMRGDKLQRFISHMTGAMNIEDMPLRFAAVACDMNTGEEIIFHDGPAHEAIRGSLSIPGVFLPHEYRGYRLIDGGCMDRLPASAASDMGADIVIAVDVAYRGGPAKPANIIEILLFAMDLSQWQNTRGAQSVADVIVCPNLDGLSCTGTSTAELAIQNGRESARAAMPQIREAIRRWEGNRA